MLIKLVAATLVLCFCVHCQAVPQGPVNFTRDEGSTNDLINCPFPAPMWRINLTLQEPLSLRPPLTSVMSSINIDLVTMSLNDTTFQCFIPSGNDLDVYESSIGTLTVTRKDGFHPPKIEPPVNQIILDHMNFNFNATHKTIAWKFENNMSCTDSAIFTIKSSTCICDTDSSINVWTTQNQVVTIPSSEFVNKSSGELLLFSISVSDVYQSKCFGKSLSFIIPPEASSEETSVALDSDMCVEIPKIPKMLSLYAVWPTYGEDGDCICPLCNDGNCMLHDCGCYNTSFAPELRLSSTSSKRDEGSKYNLCWPNLMSANNETNVYFFFDALNCTDHDPSPECEPSISRIYQGSYKFIVRGPPLPPTVTINDTTICYTSYSYFPIHYYLLDIVDLTGDAQTLNETSNSKDNEECTSLSGLSFPQECSPYSIDVQAHNKAGTSNETHTVLKENSTGDVCSCMNQKIEVNASIVEITDSAIQLSVDCAQLRTTIVAGLALKISPSNNPVPQHSQNLSLPCPSSVLFTGLEPNTTFDVEVVWFFEHLLPVNCAALEFTTTIGLPSPPSLNISGDTVCFNSDSVYPIDYYSIETVDSAGVHDDQTFNESTFNESIRTNNCLSLHGPAFPPECSPYHISVRAHNQVGSSNKSTIIMQENDGGNECTCIKLKIQVVIQLHTQSVQLHLNCTSFVSPNHYDAMFALKIFSTDSDTPYTKSDNITLPCPKILTFNGLQPNTYNISIEWYIPLPSEKECMIDNFVTPQISDRIGLITGVCGASVFILIVACIVIICIKKKICGGVCRCFDNNYRPNRDLDGNRADNGPHNIEAVYDNVNNNGNQ